MDVESYKVGYICLVKFSIISAHMCFLVHIKIQICYVTCRLLLPYEQKYFIIYFFCRDHILTLFREHPDIKSQLPKLEHLVSKGAMTPGYAADILLQTFAQTIDSDSSDRESKV